MEQKFIGIKFVTVIDMTGEEAEKHGYRTNGNKGYGVEVTYEDGYKSWCPLDVFKKHNYAVTSSNENLVSTVEYMLSENYEDRLYAEYAQLMARAENLSAFIAKLKRGESSFTPACSVELFERQLKAMREYMTVLAERAEIEGITISFTTK